MKYVLLSLAPFFCSVPALADSGYVIYEGEVHTTRKHQQDVEIVEKGKGEAIQSIQRNGSTIVVTTENNYPVTLDFWNEDRANKYADRITSGMSVFLNGFCLGLGERIKTTLGSSMWVTNEYSVVAHCGLFDAAPRVLDLDLESYTPTSGSSLRQYVSIPLDGGMHRLKN